jgi:TPP-dependent pyruvate/acetoin dehydrogenase alpha subunit
VSETSQTSQMSQHAEQKPLTPDRLREMLWRMLLIRHFDTRVVEIFQEGLIRGATHSSAGQEAVAVGTCSALDDSDFITSNHRGHGHCIAKGGDVNLMMAELLGKATGLCKGKGGSMHIADLDRGILGANGIVGGGMGIATGAGLSAKMRGSGQVSVCFFGDGAINQGILYESATSAAVWKLPVIYLCENNQYAMSTHISKTSPVADISARAAAWGFPGVTVDGMDVLAVYEAVAAAVERARRGEGPCLIAATTYRYFGHTVVDSQVYRSRDEVNSWRERDAIKRFRAHLAASGVMDESAADALDRKAEQTIEAAIEFGRQSPEPSLDTLMTDIYA